MPLSIAKELTWISLIFAATVFVTWLFGIVHLAVFIFLVIYIVRNLLSAYKFATYLDNNIDNNKPITNLPSSGCWGELASSVVSKNRSLENKINQQIYITAQLKSALMGLDDSIISLDSNHKIEWFNRAARYKIKLKTKDIGNKIELLVRLPRFITYLKKGNYAEPLILSILQGIPRTVSILVVSYYKDHKLIIIKDIHQLYNIAQIRKDFIANASHELRTPLTVINGYLEMMIDSDINTGIWHKPLEQMQNQSQRMQLIITDLLTLSSLETENIIAELSVVDVPEILKMQQETSQQMLAKNQQITFNIDDSLKMRGYITPLTSIFANLIANAIGYSPKGGDIQVRWYTNNNKIIFEVEDQGVGIAQENLARITERFYRVDAARSRGHGGTGLGLAITKYALEKHNAKLIVESKFGIGSKFTCEFPITLIAN